MWTEEEEALLREKYPQTSNESLTNELDRTKSAIRCKANRMGLSKSENYRKLASVKNSDKIKLDDISDYKKGFVVGFICGEGSFIIKNESGRSNRRFCLSIELTRADKQVLEEIQHLLECGRLHKTAKRENNKKGGVRWAVQDFGDIVKKVIPLFESVDFMSAAKEEQFKSWKEEILKEVPEIENFK